MIGLLGAAELLFGDSAVSWRLFIFFLFLVMFLHDANGFVWIGVLGTVFYPTKALDFFIA
jgi:hypothetical protein